MPDYKPKPVLNIMAELGECPIWCVEDQALYWIDIDRMTINRFDPKDGKNKEWKLPAMPGCFALCDGNGAVIAARDGIYDFNFANGTAKMLCKAPFDTSVMRFNDGRTDRQGRLWAGTLAVDFAQMGKIPGAFYRYDGVTLESGISPIAIANGTAFSPDGKTMYRAESGELRVYAYDYNPDLGVASRQRVFAEIPQGFGAPDGAAIDSEGGYWVALPAGAKTGGVARFKPDGKMDFYFEMPVLVPTMIAFGGPNMSTLYITTARLEALMPKPIPDSAGNLFAVETPFRGIPEAKFRSRKKHF